MKKIINLIILCFVAITMNSQSLLGVKTLSKIDKLDGLYYNIVTNNGDEISLKVFKTIDTFDIVYADKNYCLRLSKLDDQKYCISAAYKNNNIWIQDYESRILAYPTTGVSEIDLKNVELIDSTTLKVEYVLRFLGKEDEYVRTKVSLGIYGFYDHYLKSSLNLFFSNKKDKIVQEKSIRVNYLFNNTDKK